MADLLIQVLPFTKPYIIPPPTIASANAQEFEKVRFDANHYERMYTQCRGRGFGHNDCKNIAVDSHITPANPAEQAFKSELLGLAQCMSAHNDIEKCQHYTQAIHQITSYKAPEPTKGEQFCSLVSRVLA